MSDFKKLQLQMIEKFQCPGCAIGCGVTDACLDIKEGDSNLSCRNQQSGTMTPGLAGNLNLGMPKGFAIIGPLDERFQKNNIRIFADLPEYNFRNIPFWAMEYEGYLLVRCAVPRLGQMWVDVIPNKKISDLPEPYRTTCVDIATVDQSEWFA